MYGIFTYIFLHKHQPNVGKYTIKLMVPVPRSAGTPTFRRIDSAPVRSQVSKYTMRNEELLYISNIGRMQWCLFCFNLLHPMKKQICMPSKTSQTNDEHLHLWSLEVARRDLSVTRQVRQFLRLIWSTPWSTYSSWESSANLRHQESREILLNCDPTRSGPYQL